MLALIYSCVCVCRHGLCVNRSRRNLPVVTEWRSLGGVSEVGQASEESRRTGLWTSLAAGTSMVNIVIEVLYGGVGVCDFFVDLSHFTHNEMTQIYDVFHLVQ